MYLVAGLFALLFGPVVYEVMHQKRWLVAFLDGFIVVSIAGLLALEVLPDILGTGGWWSLLFVALGLIGPTIAEQLFRQHARQMHLTTLIFGAAGLILHTLIDGAILHTPEIAAASSHAHDSLPLAVLLHRLPVGLAVWWVLRPSLGLTAAVAAVALMAVGTVAGYALGGAIPITEMGVTGAWIQAFVAGTILHVVLYRPHLHDHEHPMPTELAVIDEPAEKHQTGWAEGWGNLVGLVLLLLLFGLSELNLEGLQQIWSGLSESGHADHAGHAIADGSSHSGGHSGGHSSGHAWLQWLDWETLYLLAATSAPALIVAYLLGGVISVFMPDSNFAWLQRGSALGQASKGMVIGLPLPICSCGVVPLYRSLIERGVPPTAGFAFLIATPEIGLDAILLSLPLLGVEMTIARVLAAAALALLVGWGVGRWLKKATATPAATGCCGGHAATENDHQDMTPSLSLANKTRLSLRQGLIELVDNTAPWIVFGLLLATVAQPLLTQSWLTTLPGAVEVVLFGLIGMPIYVCATGATPLVAVFLAYGVSPGAAVAFLLTGPATNVTTFGVLRDLHGAKAALAFALVAGSLAIGLGLIVNMILPNDMGVAAVDLHEHDVAWWQNLSLVLLVLLFGASVLRKGLRAFVGSVFTMPGHSH